MAAMHDRGDHEEVETLSSDGRKKGMCLGGTSHSQIGTEAMREASRRRLTSDVTGRRGIRREADR